MPVIPCARADAADVKARHFGLFTMRILSSAVLLLLAAVFHVDAFTVFPRISYSVKTAQNPHISWINTSPLYSTNDDDFAGQVRVNSKEATQQVLNAELRVEELERTIRSSQRDLGAKQKELEEAQNKWEDEKKGFFALIGELTDLVSSADDDAKATEEMMKAEAKEQQQRLEQEIQVIQASLLKAQEALKGERDAAIEIKNRLMSAEDQLEFEQMRFEKEKKELGEKIRGEKDRLNSIESQFVDERQRFQVDRSALQEQIEAEATKLQEAETDLKQELARFENERNDLRQLLREQSQKLAEAAKKLTQDQTQFQSDRVSLEKAFQQEKEKLERTMSFLETEQAQFEEAKTDLETKIVYEKGKVKNLSTQLEKEDLTFRRKREELERGIATEKANIQRVETQLEKEAERMAQEKSILRDELEEQRKLRRLQAKEMNQQFTEVRSQLMTRWQDEKRKTRDERKSLIEAFEDQIIAASNSVAQLEVDLDGAKKTSAEMRVIYDEMTQEKELLINERQESEVRYKRTLENRDGIIQDLRAELDTLYDDIYDRDQKIAKYESSLRELFGLSVQLTKKRVGRVFRRRDSGQSVLGDADGEG